MIVRALSGFEDRGGGPGVAAPIGLASEARLQGWRPLSASQARQRSRVATPIGLASEATLQGGDPYRPRKRGSAPGWRLLSGSQARQRSRGAQLEGVAHAEIYLHEIVSGAVDEVVIGFAKDPDVRCKTVF